MLTAAQVARLRQMAQEGDVPSRLDALRIHTLEVSIDIPTTSPILEIQASQGVFYEPERIFGDPIEPSCLNGIKAGPLRLVAREVRRIEQARISGTCAVLGPAGDLYSANPVTRSTIKWDMSRNGSNHLGFLLTQEGDRFRASFLGRDEPRSLPYDVIFFHNIEPGNYGSFLIRQLQQMSSMNGLCEACDAYVTPERTPWFMEALILLGLPQRPVFLAREIGGETLRSVTFANDFDNEGFVSEDRRDWLRSRLKLDIVNTPNRHIYISRALSSIFNPQWRTLINSVEIEEEIKKRSYEVIYPETLRLIDQAQLFTSARQVIGPSGSGMLNTIFSSPGIRVLDMESMTVTVRQHAKVYASAGAKYGFLFGNTEEDTRPLYTRRWSISPQILRDALDWISDS
jgi:capsular polysaccharide biosynthesis protein